MDEATRLVRQLVDEVWNGGKLDRLPDLFADHIIHSGHPDTVQGLLEWHYNHQRTWADVRYEIVQEVSDGQAVAVHWRAVGRQVGTWGPLPPTGRIAKWHGAHFFTVRDGKIVELWSTSDAFSKAVQLGAQIAPPDLGGDPRDRGS